MSPDRSVRRFLATLVVGFSIIVVWLIGFSKLRAWGGWWDALGTVLLVMMVLLFGSGLGFAALIVVRDRLFPPDDSPMEQSAANGSAWKPIFFRAAGFGAGATLCAAMMVGLVFWYVNRPAPVRPWNRDAITAKYSDLYAQTGNSLVVTFRYTVENHSGHDYELPTSESLYKVLASGKGLQRDATLKWDGGPVIPAGQTMNVGIQIVYEFSEFSEGPMGFGEKLNAFTKRRLSEIDGFAMLDQVNRYEVRFPKPPEVK